MNNSHTFGQGTQPTVAEPDTLYIGNAGASTGADAIIEGLRIDRRVWYEATSGTGEPYYFNASGYIDEIAAAYDAGAGADPALVEASWDGCMCLPTDSAVGALTTGNGNAWSHPHASALLNNTWLEDTFGPNQQDVVTFNGTTTSINCGSAAVLDDLPAGGNIMTVAGWFKCTASAASMYIIVNKASFGATAGWFAFITSGDTFTFQVYCATATFGASAGSNLRDGKWHYFAGYYNDTTKKTRASIDGVWGAERTNVGNYDADAAYDLKIATSQTAMGASEIIVYGKIKVNENE